MSRKIVIATVIVLAVMIACSALGCSHFKDIGVKKFVDSGIFLGAGYLQGNTIVYFKKEDLPPAMVDAFRIRVLQGIQAIPEKFRGKQLTIYTDKTQYFFE